MAHLSGLTTTHLTDSERKFAPLPVPTMSDCSEFTDGSWRMLLNPLKEPGWTGVYLHGGQKSEITVYGGLAILAVPAVPMGIDFTLLNGEQVVVLPALTPYNIYFLSGKIGIITSGAAFPNLHFEGRDQWQMPFCPDLDDFSGHSIVNILNLDLVRWLQSQRYDMAHQFVKSMSTA